MTSLLTTTAALAATVVLLAVPLGICWAVLLFRTDVPGRRLGLALLAALLFVPLIVHVSAWDALLGRTARPSLLQWGSEPLLSGFRGAVWVHAIAVVPWITLLLGVGLRVGDRELEEASLLETTPWRTFTQVTLRRASLFVLLAAAWGALSVAGEIVVTDYYQVRTAAEEIYTSLALGDEAHEIFLTLLPALLVHLLLAAGLLAVARRVQWEQVALSQRTPWVYSLGRYRVVAALGLLLSLASCLCVPLANLLLRAGLLAQVTPQGIVRRWSAERFGAVLQASLLEFRSEWQITVILAALSATAALFFGVLIAWQAQQRAAVRWASGLLVAGLWAVPAPLIGLGVIHLLQRPEIPGAGWLYDRTLAAPLTLLTLRALPYALLLLGFGLATVPRRLREMALLDAMPALQLLGRVVLPLRRRALGVAWLFAFWWSATELSGSVVVNLPDATTFSVRAFGLLHAGVDDQLAGLCLVAIMGCWVVAALIGWLVRREDAVS